MLSGPELARIFRTMRRVFSTQMTYQKQITSPFKTVQRMGNPFMDNIPELVTHNWINESVSLALCTLEDTVEKQYEDFVKKVEMSHLKRILLPF